MDNKKINCNENQIYMTLREAARFLKISMSKMQKISASRVIPVYKPSNGKVYFLKDDLLKYISDGRIISKEEIEKMASDYLIKNGGLYGAN